MAVSPERPLSAAGDEVLLAGVAQGDRRAFAELSVRHVDRTFAVARRFTGNDADAEDIVQEVFVKVWTGARKWRSGRAKFSTWLYRVTVNLCIDAHRARRRRNETSIDVASPVADPVPLALQQIDAAERQRLVDAAVLRLPDRQRAAIVLTYTEGLSNSDIADVLNISVGAVESLLVRARRKLRKEMAGLFEG